MAYSKRLDLLSELVSVVERLRAPDVHQAGHEQSVRSEQATRSWRVSDRLNARDLSMLIERYREGTTIRQLAEQFKISESSVKRRLHKRGVQRDKHSA